MILTRSKHSLLFFTFLLLAACAQSGGGSSSSTSGNDSSEAITTNCGAMNDQECGVVTAVNTERQKVGLGSLAVSSKCIAEVQFHAQDMVANNYFAHDGLTETTDQRFTRFGLSGNAWGENIAAGYSTVTAVMTGWMNSPGHKANILGASYRSMGVGLAKDSGGTNYWVQCFSGAAN